MRTIRHDKRIDFVSRTITSVTKGATSPHFGKVRTADYPCVVDMLDLCRIWMIRSKRKVTKRIGK